MADDIVTRLRFEAVWYLNHADGDVSTSLAEAADEIERLRAAQSVVVVGPQDWLVLIAPDGTSPDMTTAIKDVLPPDLKDRTIVVVGMGAHRG